MRFRATILAALVFGVPLSTHAQLSQDSRFSIVGSMIATEGAARMELPLGKNGVELTDTGVIDQEKLRKELLGNGSAVGRGKVVSITAIEFGDKSIEIELNNGGTKKKNILSHISLGAGSAGTSQSSAPVPAAIGSRITLKFAGKIPSQLSVEKLKDLLNPVLDFSKQTTAKFGADALPPEFQDAVVAKEARVGMDGNTVMLALGRPNVRNTEKNAKGIEQETWIYKPRGSGRKSTFVTFEKDVVVKVEEFQ